MNHKPWLRALALIGALMLPVAAVAADVLIMKNGDRITGTIKKIWDGKLHIAPPYAGTIEVDLDKVKTIDARRDFEFELWNDEKFTGQFGVDAHGRQVLVRDGKETPLDLAKVEEIAEPRKPFEWSARADLNADSSSGNSDTTNVLFQAYGKVRLGAHLHEGSLAFDYQESAGTTAKNQVDAGYDYNWLFAERWYLVASADYQRDPERDLNRRVSLGAGLGYQFYDDARRLFKTSLGPAYVHEEVAGATSDTGAVQWQLEFRHRFYRRRFEFFYQHDYLAYTGGSRNRVFDASTGLRIDIVDGFYANLQFDYDNETKPAPGRKDTDTKVVLGLGLKLN